jgi:hypothetical protein
MRISGRVLIIGVVLGVAAGTGALWAVVTLRGSSPLSLSVDAATSLCARSQGHSIGGSVAVSGYYVNPLHTKHPNYVGVADPPGGLFQTARRARGWDGFAMGRAKSGVRFPETGVVMVANGVERVGALKLGHVVVTGAMNCLVVFPGFGLGRGVITRLEAASVANAG